MEHFLPSVGLEKQETSFVPFSSTCRTLVIKFACLHWFPHLLLMQNVSSFKFDQSVFHRGFLKYPIFFIPQCYLQVEFSGVLWHMIRQVLFKLYQ
jgi:hypothetical protein